MLEATHPPLGGWSFTAVAIDIKSPPPEQASINRPYAGAEQRHAGGDDREETVNPRVRSLDGRKGQRDRNLVEGDQGSHCWRPQTGKQKEASCNRNRFLREGDRFRRFPRETGGPEVEQSETEAKAD